jgi:hypothetical protein
MPEIRRCVIRVERPSVWTERLGFECGHTTERRVPPWTAVGSYQVCRTCSFVSDLAALNSQAPMAAAVRQPAPSSEPQAIRTLRFRTSDHPEANGRLPKSGELGWTFLFHLEDGRTLFLEMGLRGRAQLESVLLELMVGFEVGKVDPLEDGPKR